MPSVAVMRVVKPVNIEPSRWLRHHQLIAQYRALRVRICEAA